MSYAWENTALDLLTGLKLTATELGNAIEREGYTADLTGLSRWIQCRVADKTLAKNDEHPPRFFKNKRAGE